MSRTASVSIGREDAVTADGHKLQINYENGAVSGAFIYSKSSRQVGNPIPSSCSTEPPSGSCQLPDEDDDQLFTMQQDPDPAPRTLQTAEAAQRSVAGAGLGESLLSERSVSWFLVLQAGVLTLTDLLVRSWSVQREPFSPRLDTLYLSIQ